MTSKLWFQDVSLLVLILMQKQNPNCKQQCSLISCVLHWASPPRAAFSCPWTCSVGSAASALVSGAWRAPDHRLPAELQLSACPIPEPRPGLLRLPSTPAVARQIVNRLFYWLPGHEPSAELTTAGTRRFGTADIPSSHHLSHGLGHFQ